MSEADSETSSSGLLGLTRRGQVQAGMGAFLAYGAALFGFEPNNVITPHGRRHMASAHMVASRRYAADV
jgi:hypothetical protein